MSSLALSPQTAALCLCGAGGPEGRGLGSPELELSEMTLPCSPPELCVLLTALLLRWEASWAQPRSREQQMGEEGLIEADSGMAGVERAQLQPRCLGTAA